jgi:hypothetical protein
MELDLDLVFHARRFIDGANVHYVKTWIYCYEMSLPDSPRRERYETLLRDFVRSRTVLKASRRIVELQRKELNALLEAMMPIDDSKN